MERVMSRERHGRKCSPVSERILDSSSNDDWETLFESSATDKGKTQTSKADLDLYNFEEPTAQLSRYVLTSPRSLEACGRFGIKPVELLHKSLEEFVEEFRSLYDTDYPLHAVQQVFQEHERQRLRKLKLCREERERIIRERSSESVTSSQHRHFTSRSLSPENKPDNRWRKSYEEKGQNGRTPSPVERQKYHRGSSPLDGRGKENMYTMDSKALKPPTGHTNYRSQYTSSKKSQSPVSPKGISMNYPESSDSETGADSKRTWSASGYYSNEQSPRTRKKPSSAGSSRKRNTSLIKRTASMDSIDLLRSVPLASSGKGLSEKDQRIVNLMMSRHEEEERARKERLMLELEWDEQRKIEEQMKKARQQQRQAEIWDTYKAKDSKQFEVRARRLRNEQRLKKDKLEMLLSKDSAWQKEKRKQEQIRGTKMLAKKIKETEKKQKQEENLWQKEREDELNRNMTQLNLLDRHKTAVEKRDRLSAQEHMKLQSRNHSAKTKHASTRKQFIQQLSQEEENLKHEVAIKHQNAVMNYQRQLTRKDNQMALNRIKREERIERQQEQLRRKANDMDEWRRELTVFRGEKDKQAEGTAKMVIASKQHRVKSKLAAEKDEHQQNLVRVKQALEERRREIQEDIEVKDERSRMVNVEKEEIRRLNRDAARTSQAVRDLIREQTLRSSFDRMAEAAQHQALVGRGPQTGHKNKSTLKLG